MREMLVEFISDLDDMEVIGSSASGEDALRVVPGMSADLLLVDMALPKMNGADFIDEVRRLRPELPCLVLSAHGEKVYVQRARAAGARGYVLKGDPYELPNAIRRVLAGEEYVSDTLRTIMREDPG